MRGPYTRDKQLLSCQPRHCRGKRQHGISLRRSGLSRWIRDNNVDNRFIRPLSLRPLLPTVKCSTMPAAPPGQFLETDI